jgi:hypothetical protein
MKPENMIGKLVVITDESSPWIDNWGFIRHWDGEVFHVSGGSIPHDCYPIFDRDQLRLPRKFDVFIKAGAKVDEKGREIRTYVK